VPVAIYSMTTSSHADAPRGIALDAEYLRVGVSIACDQTLKINAGACRSLSKLMCKQVALAILVRGYDRDVRAVVPASQTIRNIV
jgi:hypothetical protein